MTLLPIHQAKQRLDVLFPKVGALGSDIELQSHWARYLCVLVAGFIETSVRSVLSDYASKKSVPQVYKFVESELGFFQNPKMEKILELARSFDAKWAEEIKVATEGELKDSVNSIVANRHLIAHGENVGVTYSNIKKYYENAVKVIDIVEQKCQ